MEANIKEYTVAEMKDPLQFLSGPALEKIEKADANPLIKISVHDKSIPFIVLSNGKVVADINANNPKTIAANSRISIPADKSQFGAGYIDVYYGNTILVFRRVESGIFGKKWILDDVVSALQPELSVYYPGYQIRTSY